MNLAAGILSLMLTALAEAQITFLKNQQWSRALIAPMISSLDWPLPGGKLTVRRKVGWTSGHKVKVCIWPFETGVSKTAQNIPEQQLAGIYWVTLALTLLNNLMVRKVQSKQTHLKSEYGWAFKTRTKANFYPLFAAREDCWEKWRSALLCRWRQTDLLEDWDGVRQYLSSCTSSIRSFPSLL